MSSISTVAYRQPVSTEQSGSDAWGFASMILVVASLFIRPSDLVPQLRNEPIYQYLIIAALLLSYRSIGDQFKYHRLVTRPITACMLMLVASVFLSHLSQGFFWGARDSAWTSLKVTALYLLVASTLNTTSRIELFVKWLLVAISAMCCLALADHFGLLDLSDFASIEDRAASGDTSENRLTRICGSGIFADPNDLGLAVVAGVVLAGYFLTKPGVGWPRYLWLPFLGILLWTLAETFSRGAFISLATAIPALTFYHQRWSKVTIGSVAFVPLLALPFSGRMTDMNSVFEGTGQTRIQIWSACLSEFRASPLFGIGEGTFVEKYGLVGHNSFLQTFTETGFLGGTILITIFMLSFHGLLQKRSDEETIEPESYRLRGAIFVMLVAYTVGISTLSRQSYAPTFLLLGIASATGWTISGPPEKSWRLGYALTTRATVAGVLYLLIMYIAIKLFLRGIFDGR